MMQRVFWLAWMGVLVQSVFDLGRCGMAMEPSAGAAAKLNAAKTDSEVVLENARCRYAFDAKNGEIRSVSPGPATFRGPWFEIVEEDRKGIARWETWKHGPESVFSSGPASVACTVTGGLARAEMIWDRPNGLWIAAEIKLGPDDAGPLCRITVANRSGEALVDTIRVPLVRGVAIGGAGDWFTWPHTLGARYRVQGLKPGQTLEEPYPAFMYMQWLDLYDDSQGVYLGSLDDYGYSKKLIIGRGTDGRSVFGIAFVGCWIAEAGDRWITPWTQMAAHQGDWHAGADLYGTFARKAFGPLRLPDRAREMPAGQCWLAHMACDRDAWRLFEIQQQAPIHASYLQKSLNTSTPEGWDGLRGSALELQESFENIRRLGGSRALFTFDRAPNMGRPNYANHVAKWICRRRDGSFEEGFRDMMPSPFDPDFRKARVGEAVRWVREFGLDEIHYDTEATCGDTGTVGTGMFAGPSYQKGVPQRPNEVPHYFKELYRATVAACRAYNPDFVLRAEHGADFWYPEFAISTAHFMVSATGAQIAQHNPPGDAQLMPELFRYTLPQQAAQQCPSQTASDFWTYCYGMGHGFHGGGASWTFNPEVRNAEGPGGELNARYAFYDSDWRKYYDFRVGFAESTLDAERSEVLAEVLIDGKWQKCVYPGPLIAVTHVGGGREVTLGQWYPDAQTSSFARDTFAKKAAAPRPVRLRVPTKIDHPQIRLLGLHDEIQVNHRVSEGRIEVEIQDPTCFALELSAGPVVTLKVPKIAQPGQDVLAMVTVQQSNPRAGTIMVTLPIGWPAAPAISVPAARQFSADLPLRIPAGVFGRNYPVKVVLRTPPGICESQCETRTAAAHVKVMEPLSVIYSFDTIGAQGPLGIFALDPGKRARLTVTCVNNTPEDAEINVDVAGKLVKGQAKERIAGIAPRVLGTAGDPIRSWIEGKAAAPKNVLVKTFDFDCAGVPIAPVQITVSRGSQTVFSQSVWPRTRIMDLSGEWQVSFAASSRANVGGAERYDMLDTEIVTPEVWDGKWRRSATPIEFDATVRKANAWGYYRRLVYIPAEWQGTDLWLRLSRMGAPWGEGGTLNLVYVNGWPCGRIGPSGERPVSSFVVYGGWNLIAVASSMPRWLVDPYLFVRNSPSPARMQTAPPGKRPQGAFLQLAQRCTGQGLTLPFTQGIPEGDHRRIDVHATGEACFIYFAVADAYLYQVNGAVDIEVEYLDKGTGQFGLDYDSTDPKAPGDGAFKSAPTARRTSSGLWKTHVFHLPDARLANREHLGADFRIYGTGEDLLVRRVAVRIPE